MSQFLARVGAPAVSLADLGAPVLIARLEEILARRDNIHDELWPLHAAPGGTGHGECTIGRIPPARQPAGRGCAEVRP